MRVPLEPNGFTGEQPDRRGCQRGALRTGCGTVRYRRWSRPGAPVLLLVHGSRGHGGWWRAVGPLLAAHCDVVVPDLSGHGDSDWCEDGYRSEAWAAELAGVVSGLELGAVTLVGHSMGGKVGVFFAARHATLADALVLVDVNLRPPDRAEGRDDVDERPHRGNRVYATLPEALSRFRLRPGRSVVPPDLLERVAREAVVEVDGGWTWKFDPRVGQQLTAAELHPELPSVRCPVGIVYGEHSPLVGPHTVAYVSGRLGRGVPSRMVAGADHHVPLDAPVGCSQAVLELLPVLRGELTGS